MQHLRKVSALARRCQNIDCGALCRGRHRTLALDHLGGDHFLSPLTRLDFKSSCRHLVLRGQLVFVLVRRAHSNSPTGSNGFLKAISEAAGSVPGGSGSVTGIEEGKSIRVAEEQTKFPSSYRFILRTMVGAYGGVFVPIMMANEFGADADDATDLGADRCWSYFQTNIFVHFLGALWTVPREVSAWLRRP